MAGDVGNEIENPSRSVDVMSAPSLQKSVPTTILICDARRTVRESLARATSDIPGVQHIECAARSDELLLTYRNRPAALVLIGVQRDNPGGVETTRRFLATYPRATTLVFGSSTDTTGLAAAIAAGAHGCLRWDTSNPGSVTLPQALPNAGARTPAGAPARLTERELQVLRGMVQGKSNGEIGRELYLSQDRIKTHTRRLFRRLGVGGRAEAVAHGIRRGFVS
ncbi:DNA-binding NarL/FixJ family response regulator [Pseudonocardia hierapolitana]|uniref:DNA-binding NarL/FixJ family response regulator n=1 Tax=Pseudonocardia hierapolitana TaxID=1128676 RepID=A0A561T4M4_9PSEU|nr:response regulator transcription factor [Pseudonocardia hierapolitana]TWF82058.1 DNA-binding NarL/FixJ family response regulator [Pseudonocardia hierapolitana]